MNPKLVNQNRVRRAYRTAGRVLIDVMWEIGALYVEVGNGVRPAGPAERHELLQHVKHVLALYAGEVAAERGIPTLSLGTPSHERREAARVLQRLSPDRAAVAHGAARFGAKAEMVVLDNWPAVEAVAQVLLTDPAVNAAEREQILVSMLARIDLAAAYGVAAVAVARHASGEEIVSVSLPTDPLALAMRVRVAPKPQSPQLAIVAEVERHREQWSVTEAARAVLDPLDARLGSMVRQFEYARVGMAEVVRACWARERALDDFAGPLDTTVRASLVHLADACAVAVLAGECAARIASGLGDTNRLERRMMLSMMSAATDSPRAALARIEAARPNAEAIVAISLPAIAAVAEVLLRNDEVSGDEFRDRVTRALSKSDGLAA
jgi:hypothetical protein